VQAAFEGREAVEWCVLKHLGHQLQGLWRGAAAEDFVPRVRLDLGELELGVVWVHGTDLLSLRGAQYLVKFAKVVVVDIVVRGDVAVVRRKAYAANKVVHDSREFLPQPLEQS
jgi:hypothetical protein